MDYRSSKLVTGDSFPSVSYISRCGSILERSNEMRLDPLISDLHLEAYILVRSLS